MSILERLLGGQRKKAEAMRQQALRLDSSKDLDRIISLLNEAQALDKRHRGQYLSLAACYNMRCKRRIKMQAPDTTAIYADAVAGITALKAFGYQNGQDMNHDVLFTELNNTAECFKP